MNSQNINKIGDWNLLYGEFSIQKGDITHQFQSKVFQVLVSLAENEGDTVSRVSLIEDIWDNNVNVGQRGLTNAIWQLRKALQEEETDKEPIKTVSKLGYQLNLPVERVKQAESVEEQAQAESVRSSRKQSILAVALVLVSLVAIAIYFSGQQNDTIKFDKPHHLTYFEGVEEMPTISADGKWLAFTWERRDENNHIYIRPLAQEDTALKQISFGYSESSPAFSPDATQIAFIRLPDKVSCEVYVKDLRNLTERLIGDCHYKHYLRSLDWSPSGRYLAYIKSVDNAQTAIFLYDFETESESQLTTPEPGVQEHQLAWAKTSDTLAVIRELNYKSNLITVNLAGQLTTLIDNAPPIYGFDWAHDDSGVIYNSLDDGDFSIRRFDIASGESKNIHRDYIPYNIDTIPGKELAFVYSRHQSREYIGIFGKPATRTENKLAESEIRSSHRNLYPEYSPLLDRFSFLSNRNGFFEIWSIKADGTGARQHTDKEGLTGLSAWSPSQPLLAFTLKAKAEKNHALYITNFESNERSRISSDGFEYQHPSWSPDGKRLLISSNRGGEWNMWQYLTDSGQFEQLTESGANFAMMSKDNRWLYFSRENQQGLWRKDLQTGAVSQLIEDLVLGDWGNFYLEGEVLYYVRRSFQDQIVKLNLEDGQSKVVLAFDKNTIKGNRSLIRTPQGQFALTLLGPSEADLMMIKSKSSD